MSKEHITGRVEGKLKQKWLTRHGSSPSSQLDFDLSWFRAALEFAELKIAGRFTPGEALAICNVYRDTVFDPYFPAVMKEMPGLMAEGLMNSQVLNMVGAYFDVNVLALTQKLRTLHPLESLAVYDLVLRFWARRNPEISDRDAAADIFRCADHWVEAIREISEGQQDDSSGASGSDSYCHR